MCGRFLSRYVLSVALLNIPISQIAASRIQEHVVARATAEAAKADARANWYGSRSSPRLAFQNVATPETYLTKAKTDSRFKLFCAKKPEDTDNIVKSRLFMVRGSKLLRMATITT